MAFGIGELGFVAILMQFMIASDGRFDLKYTPVGPFPDYETCMVFKKMKDRQLKLNKDGYGVVKFKDGSILFMKSSCRLNRFANDEREG